MKELPPDPPVWNPPPERWFDQHEHDPKDTSNVALGKTLAAMWLTLLDRQRIPAPATMPKWTTADFEMVRGLIAKHGTFLMQGYREACDRAAKDTNLTGLLRDMVSTKGFRHE